VIPERELDLVITFGLGFATGVATALIAVILWS